MKSTFFSACLATLFALSGLSMQVAAEDGGSAPGSGAFSQAELDQMMAPVALYPDSLLSQILMAATYPEQVAEAARWSKANTDLKGDDAVTAVQDKGWDPAVASLAAFPQVLDIMGEKPDWVRQMGDAFLADTETVMATVQGLRRKAKEAGNLESTEQQKVVVEQAPQQTTIIKIEPADPQVVYVPAYNPTVVYGTWWWPSYPPFYYYPPGYGIATAFWTGVAFGIGIGITNAIWGGCNWRRGDVNINVNRYNKINVNKRLDIKQNNISWKNQNLKRRDSARVRLSDRKVGGNRIGGADKRSDFRGRDLQRDKARDALKGRGIDPAAERRSLKGAGGERVRDQVGNVQRDRDTRAGSRLQERSDKSTGGALRDRDTKAGSRLQERSDKSAGGALRDRPAGQRDAARATTRRDDNALSGLRDGGRSGLSTDRGRSSNRSFEGRGGGGLGGGNARSGGGLGNRAGGGGGRFGGR